RRAARCKRRRPGRLVEGRGVGVTTPGGKLQVQHLLKHLERFLSSFLSSKELYAALIGAVIGGFMTGISALFAQKHAAKHQRQRDLEIEERSVKGTLQAMAVELK